MDYIENACKQIEALLREGKGPIIIRRLYIDEKYEVSITVHQSL